MSNEHDLVCPRCGHTMPWQCKARSCPVCKTRIRAGICNSCGKFVEKLAFDYMCDSCHSSRAISYIHKLNYDANQLYMDWLLEIATLPNYSVLTEAEWLQACKHFKGCAVCGAQEITAKTFFVHFQLGGRYAAWNIIPTCDKCAEKLTMSKHNIFKMLCGDVKSRDILAGIQTYLRTKLIEARSNIECMKKD